MQLTLRLSNYTKNCKWSRKEAWCRLVSPRLWLLEGAQRSWVQQLYLYTWILQSGCQRHKPKKRPSLPRQRPLQSSYRFPNADMRQFTRSRIQGRPGMAAKSRRGWWKNWNRALWVALGFGNSYQPMLKKNVKQRCQWLLSQTALQVLTGCSTWSKKCMARPKSISPWSTEKFLQTRSKHTTRREARAWLGGPNMNIGRSSWILRYGTPPPVVAFHGTFVIVRSTTLMTTHLFYIGTFVMTSKRQTNGTSKTAWSWTQRNIKL